MAMDVIDYKIYGEEIQFVEVELDPGEATMGEAGNVFYKAADIEMETIFGDGSAQQTGFIGKLMGAGKRLLTGESLFTIFYTSKASEGKRKVAFAVPYPGKIIPIDLSKVGGTFICQKDAFCVRLRASRLALPSSGNSALALSAARVSSCKSSKVKAWLSSTRAAPCTGAT